MATVTGDSPEAVALDLLDKVIEIEGKRPANIHGPTKLVTDRKWLLDTYAECLEATLGKRGHP